MCFCTPTKPVAFCPDCNQAMFLRINELGEECDELRKDAERYRYLRKADQTLLFETPEELDAAIDSALKGTE